MTKKPTLILKGLIIIIIIIIITTTTTTTTTDFGSVLFLIFVHSTRASIRSGPPHYRGITTTIRHTNPGRTQPDGWSYRSKDPFMTTCNTQKREAAMFWEGFERAFPPRELSQTHALANETSKTVFYMLYFYWNVGRFNYDTLMQGHGVEAEIRLLSIRNLRVS